jgi:hypothetical protein
VPDGRDVVVEFEQRLQPGNERDPVIVHKILSTPVAISEGAPSGCVDIGGYTCMVASRRSLLVSPHGPFFSDFGPPGMEPCPATGGPRARRIPGRGTPCQER